MGVIEGSTILFFAYLGFDFITTISEEAKNAKKDVPIAIILSVVLSMIIYVLISFSVCGVGKLSLILGDGETALAEIFSKRGFSWMCIVI
jgi:APA family basic amino acid/polyamine antiporter